MLTDQDRKWIAKMLWLTILSIKWVVQLSPHALDKQWKDMMGGFVEASKNY